MALTARTLNMTYSEFTALPAEDQEFELASTIMVNKLEAVKGYVPKKVK